MAMTYNYQSALQKEKDDTALALESQNKHHKHDLYCIKPTMAIKEMEHMAKLQHTQMSTSLKCKTMASRIIACITNHLASRENSWKSLES